MNTASTGLERPASASSLAIGLAPASVYVLWGSTYLEIRFALPGYPLFLLGACRMFLAGAIMYLVLRRRGAMAPTGKQWRALILLSIFMVLLSNGFVNLAETQVASGLAAIAVASLAVLFGALLAGEQFTAHDMAAMAIILVGVVIITLAKARAARVAAA